MHFDKRVLNQREMEAKQGRWKATTQIQHRNLCLAEVVQKWL